VAQLSISIGSTTRKIACQLEQNYPEGIEQPKGNWPSNVKGGYKPDRGGKAAEGPSDPTNGSRRSEASNSEPRNDNKAFRPQFDDQNE